MILALYPGFAPVDTHGDFEAMIDGVMPAYVKDAVPTSGSDILRVAAYALKTWENAVLRMADLKFVDMPAKEGNAAYKFAKLYGMAIHLVNGLATLADGDVVIVELRVKTAEPTNRAQFTDGFGEEGHVRRNYDFVLEVAPSTGEPNGMLAVEKAMTHDAVVLDDKRGLWVNGGVVVKEVRGSGYVRPGEHQRSGPRRDNRRGGGCVW